MTPVDAITLAVVSGTLNAIVKEMTVIVQRTARSPIVAIGNDFSNALYTTVTGAPEMIIQGQDQPVHLGGMIVSVKSISDLFLDNLSPGDIIIRNEPDTGGSHLIDIDAIQPIFFDDSVVAWACNRVHHADIGGPFPGGYNPDAEDLFGEGLVIPPIKLIESGRAREDVWNLILANVHVPDLVRGDMGAQISAVRVATRRVEALFAKYGRATMDQAMAELLDRAERLMKTEIAAMPDGVFKGESWIEEDGHGAPDARIGCTIAVRGEEMSVSIDSPPLCRSYRNSYPGVTLGAIHFGVITGIAPGLPINEGLYRPLQVDLGPSGTMLNAERPAACALSTADVWAAVWEAVCDAICKIVPERACAAWSQIAACAISGIDPRTGSPYSTGPLHVTHQGGAGAVYGLDGGGLWGLICTGGAASVGDIELLEYRTPWHFHHYELLQDSGCPGTWRGALGATLDVELVDHDAVAIHLGSGTHFPPPSRLGGGSPQDPAKRVHRKSILRHSGDDEPFPLHSVARVKAGEHIVAATPGGGGVGSALKREPLLVAEDVRAEVVSLASARAEYGVVVNPDTLMLDVPETRRTRLELEQEHGRSGSIEAPSIERVQPAPRR